jgi:hypothetical protein
MCTPFDKTCTHSEIKVSLLSYKNTDVEIMHNLLVKNHATCIRNKYLRNMGFLGPADQGSCLRLELFNIFPDSGRGLGLTGGWGRRGGAHTILRGNGNRTWPKHRAPAYAPPRSLFAMPPPCRRLAGGGAGVLRKEVEFLRERVPTGPYEKKQRGSRLGPLYYGNITTLTIWPKRSRGCG